MLNRKLLLLLLMSLLFSSCMITTISPNKEFVEDMPYYIENNVYVSDISFSENKEIIPLILWKFNIVSSKVKRININFTNGKNAFSRGKLVDIKSVKLKFKNGIEIVPINKQLEKNESYMVYENINYFFSEQSEKQGSAGAIGVFEDSMGKKIQ